MLCFRNFQLGACDGFFVSFKALTVLSNFVIASCRSHKLHSFVTVPNLVPNEANCLEMILQEVSEKLAKQRNNVIPTMTFTKLRMNKQTPVDVSHKVMVCL